ncbi:conserved hypothetical protein [Ricinus communis]|uniref:Uncharacterized protein n=1 Tax=Ricinus communis TaxID=3988 RepID=B9SPB7_RICCO|nr:conserved hypothetical protein [Ricinus communis]
MAVKGQGKGVLKGKIEMVKVLFIVRPQEYGMANYPSQTRSTKVLEDQFLKIWGNCPIRSVDDQAPGFGKPLASKQQWSLLSSLGKMLDPPETRVISKIKTHCNIKKVG